MKCLREDVSHCILLRFKKWKNPGNAKEAKRPIKCQRLMTVCHWWGRCSSRQIQDMLWACNQTFQETVKHFNDMGVGVGVSYEVRE